MMTCYGFYQINQRAKVFAAPTVLKCRDDEVVSGGRDLVGEFSQEIWDGGGRAGTLGPTPVGFEQ